MNHIAEGSYAGSVIAALFLKRFVHDAKRFAHLDIFGWVPREQPGARKAASRRPPARCSSSSAKSSEAREQAASCPIRAATPIAPILPPTQSARPASRPSATCTGDRARSCAPSLPLRREPRFDSIARHRGASSARPSPSMPKARAGPGCRSSATLCRLHAERGLSPPSSRPRTRSPHCAAMSIRA